MKVRSFCILLKIRHYIYQQTTIISIEYADFWPKNLSKFVSLPWKLDNTYCHNLDSAGMFFWVTTWLIQNRPTSCSVPYLWRKHVKQDLKVVSVVFFKRLPRARSILGLCLLLYQSWGGGSTTKWIDLLRSPFSQEKKDNKIMTKIKCLWDCLQLPIA